MNNNNILGALALCVVGAAALAHNGATGVVMERMTGMATMRDVMRDLAPMMQQQVPYDARAVQEYAATLMAHAGDNMIQLFPEEPIAAASYAKPEIWQDWDRFKALSEELRLTAFGLATAAPNGLVAPAPVAAGTELADPMAAMDHSAMQMATPQDGFTVEQLMGVTPLAMATPLVADAPLTDEQAGGIDFAAMAADDVFEMVSQTCSSCHALFRNGN